MKKGILMILIAAFLISACKISKVNNTGGSQAAAVNIEKLNGDWQLEYISGPRITFKGLYPERVPEITFRMADSSFGGNTGCNSFNGKLIADERKISFPEHMALTRMYCPGDGETVFLEVLKKVNTYGIKDSVLTLLMDDLPMMRFVRKR